MNHTQILSPSPTDQLPEPFLQEKIQQACGKIAPLWPLDSFVAVNPYFGLSGLTFDTAADLLLKSGDIHMCMPLDYYREALQDSRISREGVEEALSKSPHLSHLTYEAFTELLAATQEESKGPQLLTFTELASRHGGQDWHRLMVNRISDWAAAYFDEGQAIWQSSARQGGLYASWLREARIDLSPGIMGLKNFRKYARNLPDDPLEASRESLSCLAIPAAGLDSYLHSLLLRLGGWAAYAARTDWDGNLYGGKTGEVAEFLAVLLSWEACLYRCLENDAALMQSWAHVRRTFADFEAGREMPPLLQQKLILQQALDLEEQRRLINKINLRDHHKHQNSKQAQVQAVFCIDVRSEVFRRNLETVSADIETLGFAGFFAFPVRYVPTAHEQGQAQCPVLLPSGPVIHERMDNEAEQRKAERNRRLQRQVEHAWQSFKLGAISCFSFVGPIGLAYLPKLFTDSFGLTRPVPHPEQKGLSKKQMYSKDVSLESEQTAGIPLPDRISMAESALQAMSLTDNFARLVLIVGHGSSTVNNPHASGLDCGACGGHTGEANARVAAAVLNDPEVREALRQKGLDIPASSIFLACQHDTTTDEVRIFNEYRLPDTHRQDLAELKKQLAAAGRASRAERAYRLQPDQPKNVDDNILARSRDWSQVRPEWGLAGCAAFIVAPREHSKHVDLQGRSFLHSYNWKEDTGFKVLELIMTAPMIVTSWISLQYYASTVDNLHHGSGNKTLHNVCGQIGVLEGNGGDLRTGLPWQSVHDGQQLQHEPVRLNVCIAAPMKAMNDIIERHELVSNLCDHGWIHLLAMDDEGKISHRYAGNLQWEKLEG